MKSLFLSLLCLVSSPLFAHPHSFLDIKNQVIIEQEQLVGFRMSWWLDEITSAELIYEINSSADKSEALKKITAEMDASAVGAHYFSELYNAHNEPVKFKAKPKDSSIEVQGNRVIYHFTLPLASPQKLKGESFRFYTFEPSYYLSMAYEKESDLTATSQSLCKITLEQPKINQELRLYASRLDKNDTPDLPAESLSLGAQFAQKVSIVCD